MPEVQEVFRMATQKVDPDPGALERQHKFQRRTTTRRKVGAFAVAAAIAVAALLVILATRPGGNATSSANVPPAVNPAETETGVVGTVTFDGSTCSMEITADRIEPGNVVFEAVNAADTGVMLDTWQVLEGYTFQEFEAVAERARRLTEAGRPWPAQSFFPGETKIRYLKSDVIPANSSEIIVTSMSGRYAIACLQRFEGAHPSLRGFQLFGVAGPIDVR